MFMLAVASCSSPEPKAMKRYWHCRSSKSLFLRLIVFLGAHSESDTNDGVSAKADEMDLLSSI